MNEILKLSNELFIGEGGHQATYIHPLDEKKCVKIPHTPNDGDVKKEMRYRKICAKKLEQSRIITKFYGKVQTNIGEGYVFERVLDYTGETSKDLEKVLESSPTDAQTLQVIWAYLLRFKSDFLKENIAIVDTDITNFMVQEFAKGAFQIRIVDNIGTPVLIPLVYYFDFAAAWKAKRYWNYIVGRLEELYPQIIQPNFAEQLRAK